MKTKLGLSDFNYIENETDLNKVVKFEIKKFHNQDTSYFTKINTIFLKAGYITCILKNKKTNKYLHDFLSKERFEIIEEFSIILSSTDEYISTINENIKNKELDTDIKKLLMKEKRKIISYKNIILEAKELLEVEKQGVINYVSLKEIKTNIFKNN